MRISLLCFLLCCTFGLPAQEPSDSARIYSLLKVSERQRVSYELDSAEQTGRILLEEARRTGNPLYQAMAYYNLGAVLLRRSQADSALYYTRLALPFARKAASLEYEQYAHNVLARGHYALGGYDSSLYYSEQALAISQEMGDTQQVGKMLSNIGVIYDDQGNYPKALDYYFRSLRIVEQVPDSSAMGYAILNIGTVYQQQQDMPLAIQYNRRAAGIFTDIDEQFGRSIALGNLAEFYAQMQRWDSSRYFAERALVQARAVEDGIGVGMALRTLGRLELEEGDREQAKTFFSASDSVVEKIGDLAGQVSAKGSLAKLYLEEGNKQKALQYARQAAKYARELAAPHQISMTAEMLAEVEEANGNYREALAAHRQMVEMKDSIFNEKFSTRIARLRSEYEIEKKQEEINYLEEQKRLSELAHDRQVFIRNLLGLIVLLFLLFSYFLWRSRQREKLARQEADAQRDRLAESNTVITEQKAELAQQHDELRTQNEYLEAVLQEIGQKNRAISASINYARRIQQATLPTSSRMQETFQDYFVLFKPRDVVSGDFYWLSEKRADGSFMFVVADCTGHGVPGALMAMAGDTMLQQIVNQQEIYTPAEVLDRLHRATRQHLNQGTTKNQDGMDMAVCYWQPQTRTLTYAGARQAIFYCSEGNWTYQKGDRLSVGGKRFDAEKRFGQHQWHFPEPVTLYLFSDGLPDQFGGDQDKKLGYKRLREWLQATHRDANLSEQQKMIEKRLEEWLQGRYRQIDDITLLGGRL